MIECAVVGVICGTSFGRKEKDERVDVTAEMDDGIDVAVPD